MKKGPTFPPVILYLMLEQNQVNNPIKSVSGKAIQCSTPLSLEIIITIPGWCNIKNQLNRISKRTDQSKSKHPEESNIRYA